MAELEITTGNSYFQGHRVDVHERRTLPTNPTPPHPVTWPAGSLCGPPHFLNRSGRIPLSQFDMWLVTSSHPPSFPVAHHALLGEQLLTALYRPREFLTPTQKKLLGSSLYVPRVVLQQRTCRSTQLFPFSGELSVLLVS